jgi:NTP pyrophosphatase (non-canonical NTP hydrolase)
VANTTEPGEIEDEVADIFWQTLKLASYLDIDLEECFARNGRRIRQRIDENKIRLCAFTAQIH